MAATVKLNPTQSIFANTPQALPDRAESIAAIVLRPIKKMFKCQIFIVSAVLQ